MPIRFKGEIDEIAFNGVETCAVIMCRGEEAAQHLVAGDEVVLIGLRELADLERQLRDLQNIARAKSAPPHRVRAYLEERLADEAARAPRDEEQD